MLSSQTRYAYITNWKSPPFVATIKSSHHFLQPRWIVFLSYLIGSKPTLSNLLFIILEQNLTQLNLSTFSLIKFNKTFLAIFHTNIILLLYLNIISKLKSLYKWIKKFSFLIHLNLLNLYLTYPIMLVVKSKTKQKYSYNSIYMLVTFNKLIFWVFNLVMCLCYFCLVTSIAKQEIYFILIKSKSFLHLHYKICFIHIA